MGRRLAVELLVIAAIGLALAALGPFGSYEVPFGYRALLWIGFTVAGYAFMRPLVPVSGWLSTATGIGRLPAQLVAITVAAVPLALLIDFILVRLTRGGVPDFGERYVQVWGIGLAITLFMTRFFGRGETRSELQEAPLPEVPASPDLGPIRARFIDRLPGTIGSPLLCLSMEDHYVRAHGPTGSALILMRMRDAMAELEGLPGLQVHRSWWVAREAVERVEREDGGLRLRLANGMVVPVARSQVGAVRAQRWPSA